jgi:hypothetical protein
MRIALSPLILQVLLASAAKAVGYPLGSSFRLSHGELVEGTPSQTPHRGKRMVKDAFSFCHELRVFVILPDPRLGSLCSSSRRMAIRTIYVHIGLPSVDLDCIKLWDMLYLIGLVWLLVAIF